MSKRKSLMVGGHNFGEINEKGEFEKHLKENHFFIKYQGFGISKIALEALKENPSFNGTIKIIYTTPFGESIIYYSDFNQWITSDKEWIYKGRLSNDRSDLQLFVSTRDMREEE